MHTLETHIAGAASPSIAAEFVDGIIDACAALADFPNRGTPRDDVRAGLRTSSHRRRVTIAYLVEPEAVIIVGVFYGGQDWASLMGGS